MCYSWIIGEYIESWKTALDSHLGLVGSSIAHGTAGIIGELSLSLKRGPLREARPHCRQDQPQQQQTQSKQLRGGRGTFSHS